jgi:hypothetical protein
MKNLTFKATNGPGKVCHLPLFRLLVEKFGAPMVPDIRSEQRNEKPETTFFIQTVNQ